MNDITIIIPTRTNVEYLSEAVESIRMHDHYQDVQILIGADNPSEDVKTWLEANQKGKFDFKIYHPPKGLDRIGIVGMVSDLVKSVKTKYVFYMHDDMVIGKHTLQKLLDNWKPKRILSSYRIEPPLYPQTAEKLIHNLGMTPKEFEHNFKDEFFMLEEKLIQRHDSRLVDGFFAPHFFAKADWVGYDPVFAPQSREDSDLAQRFIDAGCELKTVWASIVYHFSGKGSRLKDGQKDSSEWQATNKKNERNYIRKYKTLAHTEYIMPLRAPDIKISATVLVGKEEDNMLDFLRNVEPYFDEFIFVFDKENTDKSELRIQDYIEEELYNITNFDKKKFKIFYRNLDMDFASQTNFATEQASNEWVMKLDVDERFPPEMLGNLRNIIEKVTTENPNACVIGFPRINTLDGKISNDIPREHWFTEDFDKYPQQPKDGIKNPDLQFRLHRKDVSWVNPVHEVPEPVAKRDPDRIAVIQQFYFNHPKSRERQKRQEELYSKIVKPKKEKVDIKKIIYDSVIYTNEGITQHARAEVGEWIKKGYQVMLLDQNYKQGFEEYLKECYQPVNINGDDYVTIVNQPPVRWPRTGYLKNRIGYLAFEGKLNPEWVQIINQSGIKELWVPSEYNKKDFEKSGVKVPITVIPHGIDPEIWYSRPAKSKRIGDLANDQFTFLAMGTYHNDRKGLDLVMKAFTEEFHDDENVRLIFKVNKIYDPNKRFGQYIKRYMNKEGNPNLNIEFIDEDLTQEELVDLFNISDVYVAPHRAEGFGINILDSIATETPVITTKATGNIDFCKDNPAVDFIDIEREIYAPLINPYEMAKWVEPSLKSLKRKMRNAYKGKTKFDTKKGAEIIRENWTWKDTVDKMEKRIKDLF